MRDKDQPAMRAYLAAERAYYDEQTEPLRGLREDLFAEMAARLPPAGESVRWRQGAFWYFTRTVTGRQLEQFCRCASPDGPGEVLLDENLLLDDPSADGSYAELGVREVSPDGRYLAWAADSRSLLYVVTDDEYRPHEVWRHELGTAPEHDTLVYREDDERFELTVRATRSGAWLMIETASRDTTETHLIPAQDTGAAPFVIEPRKPGTGYYADHAAGPGGGELYLVTNAGAPEFQLVRAPVGSGRPGWTEVIGPAEDTRLVRCDVFGRYLVVEQRHAAATQYRRGLRRDGSAPCLLYGYGAYEACSWPEFGVTTPGLLDRGFVYAVAHVRGGGEGGRRWWTDGHLDRKRTTFTDFLAAAGMLAGESGAGRGWAAPDRIVSRGLIHEPAKWVARLRATDIPATTGSAGTRVLFRPELGAGAHAGPAGRYDQLQYEAEILSFIVTTAGIHARPSPYGDER